MGKNIFFFHLKKENYKRGVKALEKIVKTDDHSR